MNAALAVLLPLACYVPPERPLVDALVMAALRGEPVPPSAKPDGVAAALAAIAPLKRRPR